MGKRTGGGKRSENRKHKTPMYKIGELTSLGDETEKSRRRWRKDT